MNSKIKICLVLGGVLVLSSAAVQAQRHGPDGPPPFGGPMELMGFEGMHGGKTVKGAPFSATATSETTETLQDGSVIHRTSQVTMYRDSQGRSRHEATFTGFGPLTASGTPKKMVMISDPVAGVHIMLDDEQKVAHKMTHCTSTTETGQAARIRICSGLRRKNAGADAEGRSRRFAEERIARYADDQWRSRRRHADYAHYSGRADRKRKGPSDRFRAMVFGGSSDCIEEHADRSANRNHDLHRDQHSENGASGYLVYGSSRLLGASRRTRPWWSRSPRASRRTSYRQLINRNPALAAVERAGALKATIFSPEDGTPFPHLPPSMRKGRSRLWREKERCGDLE